MNKGFTLVELSIVLVIIGLLIGGILVGQSLVDAARVNRLASDLGQFEVAIVQFRDRFRQAPGDSDLFTPPGNADNIIPAAGLSPALTPPAENRNFWAHLSQAKMLSTNYEVYDPNVHGDYTNQSNSGVVWPNTEMNSVSLESRNGFEGSKFPIQIKKRLTSANITLQLHLNPLDSLSLENKLGSQTSRLSIGNNIYDEVGLVNPQGVGRCRGGGNGGGTNSGRGNGGSGYDCIDGSTRGRLNYLIAP